MPKENFSWGHFLFSFSGRINRKLYWVNGQLPFTLIGLILPSLIDIAFGFRPYEGPGLLIQILLFVWPVLAISVKRLHDLDKPGYWMSAAILPIIGLFVFIPMGFFRGTVGANRFGPDPLSGGLETITGVPGSPDVSVPALTTLGMILIGKTNDNPQSHLSKNQFNYVLQLLLIFTKGEKSKEALTEIITEQHVMVAKENEDALVMLFKDAKDLSTELKEAMLVACAGTALLEGNLNDRQHKLFDNISYYLGIPSSQKTKLIELARQQIGSGEQEEGLETKTEEQQSQVQALGIKVAIAVAMVDGALVDEEGNALKAWVQNLLNHASPEHREDKKRLFNTTMREAYTNACSGKLSLSTLIESLKTLATKSEKFGIIDLCFEIMAADSIPKQSELDAIKKIIAGWDLDYEKIRKIHEPTISGKLNWNRVGSGSIESYLGIQLDWPVARKKQLLRQAHQERVHRLNTVPEGSRREQIQQELDLIGKARANL